MAKTKTASCGYTAFSTLSNKQNRQIKRHSNTVSFFITKIKNKSINAGAYTKNIKCIII